MKEENYKDLLTIKEHIDEGIKDRIIINLSMDANDADYVDKEVEIFEPETFFGDKKLIYCLAYVSCDYDFKGHSWGDNVFSHNINSNTDIDGINDILEKYDLLVYCDFWDIWCHSFGDIKIAYYDETGKRYDITFDKIHEKWKNMSYEEICNEINSINIMENINQVKPKEYTFKSLPRLLDMIEPTSKAKEYCQKLIDTLEKEGYTTDAKIVGECLKKMNSEDIPMAIMDEKQDEQKSNGKTANRKFIVGDWITFYRSPAFKILKIEAEDNGILDYLLLQPNGHDSFYNKEYVDKNARLWTIYDAKDGDVLVCDIDKRPFIFKGLLDLNHPNCPVAYGGIDDGDYFSVSSNVNWWTDDNVKPATKEQCDFLFAKMKEAGYEWDNDKKELMKKD